MKNLFKITAIILSLTLIMALAGCKSDSNNTPTATPTLTPTSTPMPSTMPIPTDEPKEITTKDREGNDIVVTANITKIISLAPSTTEILVALGLEDKLVAVDKYSKKLFEESNTLPEFDIMNPDAEQLASLEVDIIFATGMSKAKGDDPLKLLKDMGAVVTYIPTSKSIAEIKDDILFIAEVTNTKDQGQQLINTLEKEIKHYSEIGETIINKKTVYFEIGAAPKMYSFGKNVFLNEIIELIGAKNILEDETGWIAVAPEAVVSANPDVILTNVNYIDNPIEEIKSRGGFQEINAVKNNNIHEIDNNTSNYANHNIVKAIKEIAEAVYPEEYKNK